jgi:tryptophan synthase alpha chain
LQYGLARFAAALAERGIAGAIVPDVPLEETDDIRAAFAPHGLAFPQLVAPTTPPARAEALARASEGFTYLVSRLGVTGAKKEPDFGWIAARVAALRRASDTPLAIGFGIATAEHVRLACAIADGAIVGSALIDAYAGTSGDAAAERVRAFVATLASGRSGA